MDSTPIEHTYLHTNGILLHAALAGPEEGPLVILLHGYPEFWYGWRHQIGPLAQAGFRVLAPDLRGYNLSDKPRGLSAYRLDALAADVAGMAAACGREQAYVVGHDWGGVIAWITAAFYPERVAKLAVLNAPYMVAGLQALPWRPDQLLRSAYMFYFQLPGLPEAMMRNENWALLVEQLRRTSRPGTFSEEELVRYREAWWRRGAMTSMLNYYRALMQRPTALPLFPRFEMPVQIIWGSQDFALLPDLAQYSLQYCANGSLVYLEEAGHWLHHEESRRVNGYLIEFLKTADAG